jgi:hypothetical protein
MAWLPGLAVVAIDLHVADRVEKAGAVAVAHRELGDLVVEVDEALDDDLAGAAAPAFLGVGPGGVDVGRLANGALALAGGAHDRLDHAGQADGRHGLVEFLAGRGEAVGRGRQAEFLGGQPADALAVHGQARGARRRDDGVALGLEFHQGVGGDGLDLGDDVVGLLPLDHRPQGLAVEHGNGVAAVCDLHRRGVVVAVDDNDLDAEALQFDDDFLAEFAAAAQQHAGGRGGERGADAGHTGFLLLPFAGNACVPVGANSFAIVFYRRAGSRMNSLLRCRGCDYRAICRCQFGVEYPTRPDNRPDNNDSGETT